MTPSNVFIWQGKYANEHELNLANKIAVAYTRNVQGIKENSEPAEFWTAIGGKAAYFSPASKRAQPKMFIVSDASGAVECDEVFEVVQDSLRPLESHILDAGDVIYVWFGPQCTVREEKWAMQTAKVRSFHRSPFRFWFLTL